MAKIPKSNKAITKATTSEKFAKVSKPKKSNRRKSKPTPIRQSHRLKNADKREKHIEKRQQQKVSPQVYFGTASPFLQSIILCQIFEKHLSLFEQIEMRRVCRLWHYNVKHIWAKTRSLVLTVKDHLLKPKLSSDLDKQNFIFEFDTTTTNKVELSIGFKHCNHATIDLLGDLFRNIEHLTIFYDLFYRFDYCIDNLCHLLRKFPKVISFSLFLPRSHVKLDFLSLLFDMINSHLVPLQSLHVHLPRYSGPFPALKKKNFHKILSTLQNFSLNCAVENLAEMLQTMGKDYPTPVQCLGISVHKEKSLFPVAALFEQNPKLSHLKRLELTDLDGPSLNIVNSLLDHLPELECLCLQTSNHPISSIQHTEFTSKLVSTLSKLPRLKELHLWNFIIQLVDDSWVKPLANIRKLRIVASYSLRVYMADEYLKERYQNENFEQWFTSFNPRLMYCRFLSCFAKYFPKVEHLTMKQINNGFEDTLPSLCFTELSALNFLRLTGSKKDSTFTS